MNAEQVEYVPEVCVWELTLACNMHCLHCGSSAGRAKEEQLGLSDCLRIADELLALGCRHVTLIGGEVFLYRGWAEVARRLADGGSTVNVVTNGSIMGNAQIEQLRFARVANVALSVDGMEENHNRIRGSSSSFGKVLASLDRLRQAHIASGAVTTLFDFSLSDLESMYWLFVRRGVRVWQLQIGTAMGNATHRTGLLFDPADMSRLTRFIREKRIDGKLWIYAGDDIGYFDENEPYLRAATQDGVTWRGCQAGLRVIGIDSVGNVRGCSSLYSTRFVEGNVRDRSLSEIWRDPDNFAYNRSFDVSELEGQCAACDKGAICRGGCRGSCYFSTGSLFNNTYCNYQRQGTAEPCLTYIPAWARLS
jgi:radical SAM protein with 4Fe4S-binding SPASM domain